VTEKPCELFPATVEIMPLVSTLCTGWNWSQQRGSSLYPMQYPDEVSFGACGVAPVRRYLRS
jgi:hypothetical protein